MSVLSRRSAIVLAVVLVAALVPAAAFAQFQLGATAMYKGSPTAAKTLAASDFTFGAEARLKFGFLQLGGVALFVRYDTYSSIAVLTDFGLSLDVLLFRFGAATGPTFALNLGNSTPTAADLGWNLKFCTDVNLGSLSLGLVGYYYVDRFSNLSGTFSKLPWLGVTVLWMLF